MESVESETPPRIAIRDAEHIAGVVDRLGYQTHTLSVALADSDMAFPVTVKGVDYQRRLVALELLDAQSLEASALVDQSLALTAECESETLHFDAIAALDVVRDNDVLNIQCALPATLYTTSKRSNARITLLDGMQINVDITLYENQAPIRGKLRNISVGGALLEVPLAASTPMKVDEFIPILVMAFPDGEVLTTMGLIRHVYPAGRSHDAAIGVAFINLERDQEQRLMHIVNETEREVAYRTGEGSRMSFPSPLYSSNQPGYKRTGTIRKGRREQTPMVEAIIEVSRQLHIVVLALQNQRPLPERCLVNSVDMLLQLMEKNRQSFFYAIHCLSREPHWIQHSISVAARLGDLMLVEPEHADRGPGAMIAALIHDMGKAMLVGEDLTSLEDTLSDHQREYLRGHVTVLLDRLADSDCMDAATRHDVIGCINERLDGSGYPLGLSGDALSPVARMAGVIDTLDAMMRPRGDRPSMTAIEAYRFLYLRPESFDKHWVTRYIQRHGFYPIGSLVKFSQGFLAWIMELDDSGQPQRVRVVRNLRRENRAMNDILSRVDFIQLGTLEGLVVPEKFGISPF